MAFCEPVNRTWTPKPSRKSSRSASRDSLANPEALDWIADFSVRAS